MLKKIKRSVAVMLVVTMLATMFTIISNAAELNEPNASVNTTDYSVTGNNAVGNMLADEISDYQSMNNEKDGNYVISNITMNGNVAVVEYSATGNCTILVATYDENTDVMLASGKVEAAENNNSVVVPLETESMPTAFILRAFMLDNSNKPLSQVYYSEMYTTDMQELMKSTVNDFKQEEVLNLDDNLTTNFMVYSDDVKKFECSDSTNTMQTVDDANDTYVFENADVNLKSLNKGDIFVCDDNPENPVIIKIGDIKVDGDKVTLTSTETSLEEVFECVKIESTSSLADSEVDESQCSKGITYKGSRTMGGETVDKKDVASVGAAYGDNASVGKVKIDKEATYDKTFDFSNDDIDSDEDDKDGWYKFEGEIKGSVGLKGTLDLSIYLSHKKKSVSLVLSLSAYYESTVSGSFEINPTVTLPIPVLGKAVSVNAKVGFVIRAEGSFEFVAEASTAIGFSYTVGDGFKNLSQKPKTDYSMNIEANVFIGLSVDIGLTAVDDKIATAGYSAEIGFDISGSPTKLDIDVDGVTVNHDCNRCVSGDIDFVITLSPYVKLAGKDVLEKAGFEFETKIPYHLTPWCYSFTHDDFSFNICKYATVSFKVKVLKDGQAVENADILDILNGDYLGSTDWAGVLEVTLGGNKNGLYMLQADNGGSTSVVSIQIVDFSEIKAKENGDMYFQSFNSNENYIDGYYVLDLTDNNVPETTVEPTTEPAETKPLPTGTAPTGSVSTIEVTTVPMTTIQPSTVAIVTEPISTEPTEEEEYDVHISGYCGTREAGYDSVKWVLDGSTLTISGKGAMFDYYGLSHSEVPYSVTPNYQMYYSSCVKNIVIEEGVTYIGSDAFSNLANLKNVSISSTVKGIGTQAFWGCYSLEEISFPDSITSIGSEAFGFCRSLTNVTLPRNINKIASGLFWQCASLKKVDIPEGITSIGSGAFSNCDLTNIKIPNGVKTIGERAFTGCENLRVIDIPDSVTSIGMGAFAGCGNISFLKLSRNIQNIGNYAFSGTVISFLNYDVSDGCEIVNIWEKCSYWWGKYDRAIIKSIFIGSNVNVLPSKIFYVFRDLSSVIISNGVTTIEDNAFGGCSSLTNIVIPNSVTTIGNYAFSGCGALINITIPDSVTTIGASAFNGCSNLTSIIIPDSVTTIGTYAFYNCSNLTSVTMSRNTTVSSGVLSGCPNVKIYYYEDDNSVSANSKSIPAVSAQSGSSDTSSIQTVTSEYSNKKAYAYCIIAVVRDENAEDVLAADNLFYITQKLTDKSGKISVSMPISADVTDYDVVIFGAESYRIGDVNLNDEIQIDDVTLLQKYIVEISALSDDALAVADCDINGKTDIFDATLIQMYIAGYDRCGRVGEYVYDDEPTFDEPVTTEPITTSPVETTEPTATSPVTTQPTTVSATTVPPTTVPVTTAPVETEPATVPITTVLTYTMTFTNNYNWDKVYCYYWSGETNNKWPGAEMTYSYTNDFGEKVYTIEIPNTAENVIFNNGGNGQQTVDIGISGSEKYYISGGSGSNCTVSKW